MRKNTASVAYRIGYDHGHAAGQVPDNAPSVWELQKAGILPATRKGNLRKGFQDGFNESSVPQAPAQTPTKP